MSSFVVYTYQFAPKVNALEQYSELFPDKEISPDSIMEKKQEAFQSLFDDDSAFTFTVGNETFNHQILLNSGGIIMLRIANNKKIRHEENFVVKNIDDQPSSIVIIDNRKDCQSIAIQDKRSSFSSTEQIAGIMKKSFNSLLWRSLLVVDIRRRLEEKSFWRLVNHYPQGIKAVRFGISYPNLPRVSDNVRDLFNDMAKEFGANSKYEIDAIDGQSLRLNESNVYLQGLVHASSESGHDIMVQLVGSGKRWISTGTTSKVVVDVSDTLFEPAEGKLFDDRFERIAQIMNRFK